MLDFAVENPSEDPAEVFSVVQEALEIAVDVIANADDSLGMLSEVVEELIELHAKSAQRAKPAPMELAEWFIAFHENQMVDYFELDPVAYSTVLGEDGLVRVRAWAVNADIIRRKYMEKRFAVLDQDVDAIIRTHLAEGSYAVYFEETAKALEEVGKHEAAWEYAKRGTESDPDWQARSCGKFWVELARDHWTWPLLGRHLISSPVGLGRKVIYHQRVSDSLCAAAWFTSNPRIGWGKPRL
ncbi:hypothetical protein, partial [Corynebacterium marquesiae]